MDRRVMAMLTMSIAVLVVTMLTSNIVPKMISKKVWSCVSEQQFIGQQENSKFVLYEDLLPMQQKAAMEWWQDELDRLRENSEKMKLSLEQLKKENPTRYAEIYAYLQPMDPVSASDKKFPDITMVRGQRFTCAELR